MTRREWIDFIKEHVGKIDPQRVFHKNVLSEALGLAYENFAYDTYRKTPYELDAMGITHEQVPVTLDVTKNKYYSDLPCSIIPIDKVGSGIIEIGTEEGFGYDFVPMYLHEARLTGGLEVSSMISEINYTLAGDRVYYMSMTNAIAAAGVRMTVVQQWSEYGLDENIPMPAGQSQRFIETVLNVLNVRNPETLDNNNTSNYGTRARQSGEAERRG